MKSDQAITSPTFLATSSLYFFVSSDGGEHEDGDDAALVAQRQALDDVHRGAELAGRGQLPGRDEGVRGEILRDEADDQTTDAAHGGTNEGLAENMRHPKTSQDILRHDSSSIVSCCSMVFHQVSSCFPPVFHLA